MAAASSAAAAAAQSTTMSSGAEAAATTRIPAAALSTSLHSPALAHPRRLRVGPSVAASATAACAAVLFTNIPETLKTRLQLDGEGVASRGTPRQYSGIADAFTKVWRHEGIRGLQAGLQAGLAYQCVMNGTRLGLYEPIQRVLQRATGCDPSFLGLKAAAAATSGAIGATLGSPIYLVKSRLQSQSPVFKARESHNYTSMADGLRKIYGTEGVRGLFRGLSGAVPRVVSGGTTQLVSYDLCKAWCAEAGVPAGLPLFFASSLATSFITVTVMNPFDVISTRLYQSAGKATRYSGPIDCAAQTVRAEGVMALQKGWTAQYARLGEGGAVCEGVREGGSPRGAVSATVWDVYGKK